MRTFETCSLELKITHLKTCRTHDGKTMQLQTLYNVLFTAPLLKFLFVKFKTNSLESMLQHQKNKSSSKVHIHY